MKAQNARYGPPKTTRQRRIRKEEVIQHVLCTGSQSQLKRPLNVLVGVNAGVLHALMG